MGPFPYFKHQGTADVQTAVTVLLCCQAVPRGFGYYCLNQAHLRGINSNTDNLSKSEGALENIYNKKKRKKLLKICHP